MQEQAPSSAGREHEDSGAEAGSSMAASANVASGRTDPLLGVASPCPVHPLMGEAEEVGLRRGGGGTHASPHDVQRWAAATPPHT